MHRLLTSVILQDWDSITDGGLPAEKEQPLQFDAVSQQPCGACWLSLTLHSADCASFADGRWAYSPTVL